MGIRSTRPLEHIGARPLRVLHVIYAVGPTNAQFNEHCLPVATQRELSIVSFFPSSAPCPPSIGVFEGNGTVRGFLHAMRSALAHGGFDVIHAHALPLALALIILRGWPIGRMRDTMFTVHTSYPNYRPRYRAMLYPVVAAFSTVVFCSHASLQSMPRAIRWISRNKSEVVQNGVDLERVDRVLAGRPPRAEGPYTVASVGRLNEAKDPVTLTEAFARAAGPLDRLVFAGEGPQLGLVRAAAARGGVSERVATDGLVERESVYRIVAGADVFVSASRVEGLPVAVLEAMACARPVILSDIPQHREIVGDDPVIELVRPGDVGGFASALSRMRERGTVERSELGARCRAIAERFDVRAMHRRYGALYERISGAPDVAAAEVLT